MKAETKIMHQRLEALKLAEELGNVSRVCRDLPVRLTHSLGNMLLLDRTHTSEMVDTKKLF